MPLGAAIACGLVAALFYFSLLTGSPGALILMALVQLPLFGAGLVLGVKGAVVASGTAALATAYGAGTLVALIFLAVEAMPVILLVGHALRRRPGAAEGEWPPAGALAVSLVLIGVAALVAGLVILAAQPEGILGGIEAYLKMVFTALLAGTGDAATESSAAAAAHRFAPFFPASTTIFWLIIVAINGCLAQGLVARFGWSLRPSPDIAQLELPRWLAAPLLGAVVLAVAAADDLALFGQNLATVLAFAYLFGGLAVLHAALRRFPGRIFLLMPAYLLMVLGWPVLLLAACGMIDQWFGLRRFVAAASRQGD